MINKIILPVLAVLLLGSCANKFSLVKRKYNKGYYLDVSHANTQKKNENEKALALKTKKTSSISTSADSEKREVIMPDFKPVELQSPLAAIPAEKKQKVAAPQEAKQVTASAAKKSVELIRAFKPLTVTAVSPGKGNADANLIILVILCFLWWLNLIAVYIHDGKKITLNFWITLLLDFTFIGGVIFSLLVVLDVINLA